MLGHIIQAIDAEGTIAAQTKITSNEKLAIARYLGQIRVSSCDSDDQATGIFKLYGMMHAPTLDDG